MEVFHCCEFSVAEVSEVNGTESAVTDFAFRVEVVSGSVKFIVGENRWKKTR